MGGGAAKFDLNVKIWRRGKYENSYGWKITQRLKGNGR